MIKVKYDQQEVAVESKDGKVTLNGNPCEWDLNQVNDTEYHVVHNHKSYNIELINYDEKQKLITLKINGKVADLTYTDEYDQLLESIGISANSSKKIKELKAPMPGLVLEVVAEKTQNHEKGDTLLILEAMKMENIIKSPDAVEVNEILVKPGDSVEKNQVLMTFA